MRKELNEIEKIEKYLAGNLHDQDVRLFENELKTNADLRSKYEFQKGLAKQLKRGAMVVALNQAHAKWAVGNANSSGFSNLTKSLVKLFTNLNTWLVLIGISAITFFSYWSFMQNENDLRIEETESVNKPNKDLINIASFDFEPLHHEILDIIDAVSIDSHAIELEKPVTGIAKNSDALEPNELKDDEAVLDNEKLNVTSIGTNPYLINPLLGGQIVDTVSGTRIVIPKNAFRYEHKKGVPRIPVKIIYKEYRTVGDLVMSNIPMHWFGMDSMPFQFHTEGIFSIKATTDSGIVHLAKPLQIEYKPNNLVDLLDFFYLADTNSQWQFVQEIYRAKKPIDTLAIKELKKFGDEAFKSGFEIEAKPNWAEPDFGPDGAYRYGFLGRAYEFITKGTVYGIDSSSFKRVFTERRFVQMPSINKDQIATDGDENSKTIIDSRTQIIRIKKMGYYGYNVLLKNPSPLRPKMAVSSKNGLIDSVFKVVAIEEGVNSAFHFYNNTMCLNPNKSYCFFAFSTSGQVYFSGSQIYESVKSDFVLHPEFEKVNKQIKSLKSIDNFIEWQQSKKINGQSKLR